MIGDSTTKKGVIQFFRDFRGFTGGHLKVWHYFNHTLHSKTYTPRISFSSRTLWNNTNPWIRSKPSYDSYHRLDSANALFLAGLDWRNYPKNKERASLPVINLIQHVRHADPNGELFSFLSRPAIRICVSEPVTQAILNTGQVAGPVLTIPNGIDVPNHLACKKSVEKILILGLKNPEAAARIDSIMSKNNVPTHCVTSFMPRDQYLQLISDFSFAVFLPHHEEGFYLPALEAMSLGRIVICPDCVGNREYGDDKVNGFFPRYTVEHIVDAIFAALRTPSEIRVSMEERAKISASKFSLQSEQRSYLEVLDQLTFFWGRHFS